MKKGFRSPSIKKSISARTTGKINRSIKKATNPLYGKKGMGYINNPQKAIYNKVYNKTTVGVNQVFEGASSASIKTFDAQTALTRIKQLNETSTIINTTTNVSTFFSRYEFALQICDELVNYEYTGVIKTITPTQQKRELLEQMPSVINSLIVRSYEKEWAKAQELKTEKGRKNRIIRFFINLVEELNQYGAKYITETNILKIHELLSELNIENEVIVDLTPVTITMPSISTPSAVIQQPIVNTDEKKVCPNCKGIFINHNICPDCNRTLIYVDDYQINYKDKDINSDTATGTVAGCAIGIYCCPLLIIGIFLCVMEMYGIAFIFFAIYALIIFATYTMGKK